MNRTKAIYWISTAILSLIMIFSASNYFLNHEMVKGLFESYNYPTYIIYPLAVVKILGVVAIISDKSRFLKEWAYAGFFFDMVLALAAHLVAADGGQLFALVGLSMLIISRIFWDRLSLTGN